MARLGRIGRYAIPIDEKLLDYIVAHRSPLDGVTHDLAGETETTFPHATS